jgi:hypothetical protein
MLRTLAAVFATIAMVASGLLHGYWTDRWKTPVEPAVAAARLEHIPTSFGDWEVQDVENQTGAVDPSLAGSLQRQYVNRRTGQKVVIVLVCGRPGPVSIHTPEACYGASGYLVGGRTRAPAPGSTGEFWTADAIRTTANEETKVRIYWAWNAGTGWTPADDARITFARAPVLHKLYVVRDLSTLEENSKADPCLDFMQALLPQLDRVLFVQGP